MSITLPSFLRKAVALAALTAAAVAPAVAQRFVVTGQVHNAQTKAPEEFVWQSCCVPTAPPSSAP